MILQQFVTIIFVYMTSESMSSYSIPIHIVIKYLVTNFMKLMWCTKFIYFFN